MASCERFMHTRRKCASWEGSPAFAFWPMQSDVCCEMRQGHLRYRDVGVGLGSQRACKSRSQVSSRKNALGGKKKPHARLDASVVLNQGYRKANGGSKGLRKLT